MLQGVIFYLFAFITIASAVMVVSSKNPVHSVLFLILSFFTTAALFVLLGAEFLAMILVIVYVGAVAVLFLFVVMMLNVNFSELRAGFIRNLPVGLAVAAVLFLELLMVIQFSVMEQSAHAPKAFPAPAPELMDNVRALGNVLYTDYVYPFQVSGLILLVAMIGAIVLTLRQRPGVKKQNISVQVSRKKEDSVEVVQVKSRGGV